MATLTKSVKVTLSEEQYDRLRSLADKQHESVASLIRDALSNLLENSTSQKIVAIGEKPKRKLREYEAYGMWADRDDMADGAKWVRKQRERWKERLSQSEQ